MVSGVQIATNSVSQSIALLLDALYGGGEVPVKLEKKDVTALQELYEATAKMTAVLEGVLCTYATTDGDPDHFPGAKSGDYFRKDLYHRAHQAEEADERLNEEGIFTTAVRGQPVTRPKESPGVKPQPTREQQI